MAWAVMDKLSVVGAEGCNVEFVEYLSLRLGLFDDDTQIRLQGNNLATELTISSNMSKGQFRIGCCQGCDACFVLPPGKPYEA